MARKKIIDSNACKFSLFITGDNKEILDELANNYQLKYGPMINKIIKTFCRMPKPVKKVFETTCISEYKRIIKELALTNNEGYCLNLDEYLQSPTIGLFSIEEQSEDATDVFIHILL